MEYDKLIKIGFEIIEEEDLPKPHEIKFRHSLYGTKKRIGTCISNSNRITGEIKYKIIVHTTKPNFVRDDNGKYRMKKDGLMYRRAVGIFRSFDEMKLTLAHEIAHLKFWNHNVEHLSYTNYILEKINKKLEV